MKDWFRGIVQYIVSYALRFIIGFVLLVGILYLMDALGVL